MNWVYSAPCDLYEEGRRETGDSNKKKGNRKQKEEGKIGKGKGELSSEVGCNSSEGIALQ